MTLTLEGGQPINTDDISSIEVNAKTGAVAIMAWGHMVPLSDKDAQRVIEHMLREARSRRVIPPHGAIQSKIRSVRDVRATR